MNFLHTSPATYHNTLLYGCLWIQQFKRRGKQSNIDLHISIYRSDKSILLTLFYLGGRIPPPLRFFDRNFTKNGSFGLKFSENPYNLSRHRKNFKLGDLAWLLFCIHTWIKGGQRILDQNLYIEKLSTQRQFYSKSSKIWTDIIN